MGKESVLRGLAAAAVLAGTAGMLVGGAGSASADNPTNCGSHFETGYYGYGVYYHNCAYAAAIIDVNPEAAPTRQYCVAAKDNFFVGKEWYDGRHMTPDRVKLNHYLDGTYCEWRP